MGAEICSNCSSPSGTQHDSARVSKPPAQDAGISAVNMAIQGVCGERYQVVSKLGTGAFGEVYKADDTLLNRTVAIKRIRLDSLADENETEDARRRFLREAQVAAQLQHSNIVTIFDIIAGPQLSLIVMEFVEGITLRRKLSSEKSLPLSETVQILSQVAEGLDHAHEHKVVHRDIKPANILISRSGAVKVADFGIAKAEFSKSHTATGSILGTPDYMSPEQARGETVDGRSDFFSLGSILYQCLAGETPFRSSNLTGILLRVVSDDPPPIDCDKLGLPSAVQTVLKRALAKNPAERFASGAEFTEALRSLPQGDGDGPVVTTDPTETTGEESTETKPDSVADSLMKEARSTTEIQPLLIALEKDKRRLCAAASPLLHFQNVSLTSEEAYILSRVDGQTRPADILSVSPVSEPETARALLGLIRTGLICFEGDQASQGAPAKDEPKESAAAPEPSVSDDKAQREIENLYELSQTQNDWQVLGVDQTASRKELKTAFQEKAFRYHPDRYARLKDAGFQKKLSFLFTRVSHAFAALSDRTETAPQLKKEKTPVAHTQPDEGKPSKGGGKPERASGIFRQAKTAFENKDYWRAIELCKEVVEIDESKAEYFHLLGAALSQNPKWTHDAEKNLRKAADLDPSRPEYPAALGKLYRSQGLRARAERAFKKVRAMDPDFPIDEKE